MLTPPAADESSCLFSIAEKNGINKTVDRSRHTDKPVEPDEGSLSTVCPSTKIGCAELHFFPLSLYLHRLCIQNDASSFGLEHLVLK